MAKTELTLLEVYEECLRALHDRENSLERLRSSLDRLGVDREATRADFEPLLERNRMTRRAVNLLRATSSNELEQLRFERDQLLAATGRIAVAPDEGVQEVQADG